MANFLIFLVLHALITIDKMQCVGQFFQIKKDDLPLTLEEPLLSSDVFDCDRQKSCTTLTRNSNSNAGVADIKNGVFSISKTTDPSTKYSSCATAMQVNDNKEGYYNIHHGNMLHSVEVECKVINGTTYAIIHHNSEVTELIKGYEAAGSFRRQIKYVINLEEVKIFVDASTSCSQLTRFDCHHSIINENTETFSYFVDRNSIPMAYIGGGPIDGRGCACGIANQCVKDGTFCNCDKNDYVWRQDSGLVMEKHRLPLTEVRIGDTGNSNEMMRYTVGPLNCQSEV